MKTKYLEKRYSEPAEKLHIPCPYSSMTGINVHVVIKNGHCYRSESCLVLKCKFNRMQSDIKTLLSLTW